MHGDLGLRERKKAETRQAIADAALALAVERGPGDVTVDDIAAAAGVSARTVFNYFPTKEAAILGVDPQRRRDLLDRLAARPADEPPLQALREALRSDDPAAAVAWRTRGRLARDHSQLQSAYLAGFATLEDELTAVIAARLPAGASPGADPEPDAVNLAYARLVVIVALSAMRVAVDAAIDAGSDVTDAVDRAFDAVAGGLRPPDE